MNISSAFPSKYMKADDFADGERRLVMESVELERMEGADGEEKPVLYFQGEQRGLVLNKTNATTIEAVYGAETDAWTGRPVTVYRDTTMFSGRRVPCIRIKVTPQATATAPAAAAPADLGDMF